MFTEQQRAAFDFDRFMRMVRIGPSRGDCWEWVGNKPDGLYGHFSIDGQAIKAHRWLYEKIVGPVAEGQVLRHSCDNPSCVNPMHLLPGTNQQNTKDMFDRGRAPNRSGEKHPLARVDSDDVREIRRMAELGATQNSIATKFGISRSQVYKIIHRVNWDHI